MYLATEIHSEKQVACKIVDLKLAMENLREFDAPRTAGARWASRERLANEQKKRVLREIRILAKLSHVSHTIRFSVPCLRPLAKHYQPQESFLL